MMSQDLLVKKQRLNNAQKKYNAEKQKLKLEEIVAMEFEQQRAVAEERYKANEKAKIELDRNIRI